MAWDALKAHKLRSVLTTLGILIGVTTIITIWTTIQGLNQYVYGQLSNIGSATVYVQKWPWVIKGDFWKYRNRKEVTMKEYEEIKKHSVYATHISPEVFSMKTVSYRSEKYDQIIVMGTNHEYMITSNIYPQSGRFITETDVQNKQFVCVLGSELAENLFREDSPLGKRVKIGDDKYRVIGVLEKQGSFFGESQDNYVVVPISSFRRIYGGQRGIRIAVQTDDINKVEALKDELRGIMRRVRKTSPAMEDDFAINQQDMLQDLYKQLTATLFAIVFIIGGISLLVGGIGIMNIMLVSVTERTREIGVRKAIGAKSRNILSQFLIESVAVSSVGGGLGIVFGYLAGLAVLSQMELTTGVGITAILIGFGFSTLVGVLAGFYPALKAAKLNPIDSLRYE
ncbi:MAG: ABC transporter permease [Calditrichaceae bacterium]|nr:ABC transporter permease [Calditrichaceae bacterium]